MFRYTISEGIKAQRAHRGGYPLSPVAKTSRRGKRTHSDAKPRGGYRLILKFLNLNRARHLEGEAEWLQEDRTVAQRNQLR